MTRDWAVPYKKTGLLFSDRDVTGPSVSFTLVYAVVLLPRVRFVPLVVTYCVVVVTTKQYGRGETIKGKSKQRGTFKEPR